MGRQEPEFVRIPANRAILEHFSRSACFNEPANDRWRPDGWQLRSHPDLIERIDELGTGLASKSVYVYGRYCLCHPNMTIFAYASGNWGIGIRISRETASQTDIETANSPPVDGWHTIRGWSPDLPAAVVARRLQFLLRTAFDDAAKNLSRNCDS